MKLPGSVHHIYNYNYLCVQTESCGFIINGVIVKDEENANYYPARRYNLASVGVTPRIFPTFTIAQKQEELESSVLQ